MPAGAVLPDGPASIGSRGSGVVQIKQALTKVFNLDNDPTVAAFCRIRPGDFYGPRVAKTVASIQKEFELGAPTGVYDDAVKQQLLHMLAQQQQQQQYRRSVGPHVDTDTAEAAHWFTRTCNLWRACDDAVKDERPTTDQSAGGGDDGTDNADVVPPPGPFDAPQQPQPTAPNTSACGSDTVKSAAEKWFLEMSASANENANAAGGTMDHAEADADAEALPPSPAVAAGKGNKWQQELRSLAEMGFANDFVNNSLLDFHNGNVSDVIARLVD